MSEEIGRVGGPKNLRDALLISSETADRNRHEIYEFGPFRLEPAERKLSRGDEVVTLTPKVFDMLVMLVRHSGHLLEKDDLIRSLWPDSFVEEGNLSNNIFVLRKALGNDREYIETVPRRGYRFVGAVRQLPPTGATRFRASSKGRYGRSRAVKRAGAGRFSSQPWPPPCCFSPPYSSCEGSGAKAPRQARTRLIWQSNNGSPRIPPMFPCKRRRSRPMASISHTRIRPDSICARFPAVKRGAGACQKTLLYFPGVGTRTAHIS